MTTDPALPSLVGKSQAYIDSVHRTIAQLRIDAQDRKSGHAVRNDAAQGALSPTVPAKPVSTFRHSEPMSFRTDGAEPKARPVPTAAQRGRARLMQETGMRQDQAERLCGLVDPTERDAEMAAAIARAKAANVAQRLELERKLTAAGVSYRADGADTRASAASARARMHVRGDMLSISGYPLGQAVHYDHAPVPRSSSAAEAREALRRRGQ